MSPIKLRKIKQEPPTVAPEIAEKINEVWKPTEESTTPVKQKLDVRLKCNEGVCAGKFPGAGCTIENIKFSCFKNAPEHAVFFNDFAVYVSPKPPKEWIVEIFYEHRKNLLVAKTPIDQLFTDLRTSQRFANFQSKIKEIYKEDNRNKIEEIIKELQVKFQNPSAKTTNILTIKPEEDPKLLQKAMELLRNPNMLTVILNEYNRPCYGERDLMEFLHIVCTARYVKGQWLHISGLSRGGKDTVVRAVLDAFPEEDLMPALRFSEHGLEYSGPPGVLVDLDGKIIYVSESKGLRAALDTLRPLFGQKGKTFTTYTVDTSKGAKGKQLKLKGCPVLINTSVIPTMSEETTKRFWLASIDESEEQTKGVQELEKYKRSHPSEYNSVSETRKVVEKALTLYPKNASVFVPYADLVNFPTDKVRYRGDLDKFLDFIESVAYTYMFQRSWIKTGDKTIVIANVEDFNIAKRILAKFFTPTLMDLPEFIAAFYKTIEMPLRKAESEGLTVKEIVRLTNKSDDTVRNYMNELRKAGLITSERKAGINHYYLSFEPLDAQTINNITLNYNTKEINKRVLEEMKVYLEKGAEITYRQVSKKRLAAPTGEIYEYHEYNVSKEMLEKILSNYN
jgi:DNA-binding transcriptional ArsR family regulator